MRLYKDFTSHLIDQYPGFRFSYLYLELPSSVSRVTVGHEQASATGSWQSTEDSPGHAMAPKLTVTSTHINWDTVKVQGPVDSGQGSVPITASPQQIVVVSPVQAKGVIVMGTQILASWETVLSLLI